MAIRAAIQALRQHPCMWPLGDHAGVRERHIEGYWIGYEVDPDTCRDATAGDVTSLRIIAPRQDAIDPRRG